MSKKYMVEEFREMATEAEVIEVYDQFYGHDMYTIADMLRQAADTRERIEKEIKLLKDLLVPTCYNCRWGCAFANGKTHCEKHRGNGSEVFLVDKIKFLKELIDG